MNDFVKGMLKPMGFKTRVAATVIIVIGIIYYIPDTIYIFLFLGFLGFVYFWVAVFLFVRFIVFSEEGLFQ